MTNTITIDGHDYMTTNAAAEIIFGEYTPKTRMRVHKAMNAGKLRHIKIGKLHFLHADDVERYAALPPEQRNQSPRSQETWWNGKRYRSNSAAARAAGVVPSTMLYRQAKGYRGDADMVQSDE